MFAALVTIAAVGVALYVVVSRDRAAAARQSRLSESVHGGIRGSDVRGSPCCRGVGALFAAVVLVDGMFDAREAHRRHRRARGPHRLSRGVGANGGRRVRRSRRPDGGPRLHPERPVRPVLPRRPEGLLPRRRAQRHLPEQDRSGPRDARRPGRHRHRRLRTARASSRPAARASRSATSRRSTRRTRTSSSPRPASGITTAADLKGSKVGIPGKYGSSWVMLQALLKGANLTPDDCRSSSTPTSARPSRSSRAPSTPRRASPTTSRSSWRSGGHADDDPAARRPTAAMPGPGLIASTKTIDAKRAALTAFVAATLRAMRDIEADPERRASMRPSPWSRRSRQDRATQLKVLQATAAMWESDFTRAHGQGAIDTAALDARDRVHVVDRARGEPGHGRPAASTSLAAAEVARSGSARASRRERRPQRGIQIPVDLEEPVVRRARSLVAASSRACGANIRRRPAARSGKSPSPTAASVAAPSTPASRDAGDHRPGRPGRRS